MVGAIDGGDGTDNNGDAPTAMRDMKELGMPEVRKRSLDAPDEALPLGDKARVNA